MFISPEILTIIGWVGSSLFIACAIPQVKQCMKDGHANGITTSFLAMWLLAEVISMVYALGLSNMPLFWNYFLSSISVIIICYYKKWPRKILSKPLLISELPGSPKKKAS